jgi:hypothetical protein
MTRWLARIAIALALVAGGAVDSATAFGGLHLAEQDAQSITVFVTRTGAKYHRDACRYLSRSKIPMSLKEAARRFDPCSVCRPPVLK